MSDPKSLATTVVAQCKAIATNPLATPDLIADAIQNAFEIGVALGRVEGATDLDEQFRQALSAA